MKFLTAAAVALTLSVSAGAVLPHVTTARS